MKKVYVFLFFIFGFTSVWAQTNNYFGTTGTLSGSVWNTNPAGPYTNALVTTGGAIINFGNAATFTGATITVFGINATEDATATAIGGTIGNFGNGIVTVDVLTGKTLDFSTQAFTGSATAGYIKNGGGVFALSGGAYGGGFTLNAGTLIARGVNAMGGNATAGPLTINGGTIAANATRTFAGKYSAITVGGDFTLGATTGLALTTANLTFNAPTALGASTNRKITIGGTGTYFLNGIISGAGSSLTIDNTAAGIISFGAVNTYDGGTTLTGGTLQMGLANALPSTGTMNFNGGTLKTGTGAGFSQSTGTLNLTANSTIAFGTGVHSLSFANSSAVGWTAGQMITITGWTGGYNGTSGTNGKIFVGSDATGLTAGQLAQVQFFNGVTNFTASILSTGEVVAGVAGSTPDIALSSPNPAVAAGNILQGSTSATNNPIYRFDLAVTTAAASLTGVTINTTGTYAASDITNFKCWYSSDAVFSPGTDILLSTISTGLGAGAHIFTPFTSQVIASGTTGYIFITADVPCAAVVGNNINVTAIAIADLSFASGNLTQNPTFDGGLQTITAATPNDVTAPAASVANSSSSLSWVNPAGCYNEVLIVAATASNTGTPTGDGTAYTGSLVYGGGTALGNGFVVYKGTVSPELVTALTNGTPYFYKFFTRFGTTWSAGVEVSATPALVSVATDYFRSVASGAWATLGTWESSSDSISWIPATLIPGATAAHVTVQSPDSVWLTAARTTANLTIMSGAAFNATTFAMTATARFHLYGTASFYQGGSIQSVPGVGVEQVLDATSNYHFNGTQAGTSNTAYPAFGNLIWEPTASGSGTFQNSATLVPANLGLYVRGDMTINIQGGTPREVRFATGASITRSHVILGNLNIISASSVAVVTNGGIPVLSTLRVDGNINISAGILQGTSTTAATDGSAILNLSGNINNTGGTIQTGASAVGLFSINYVGTGAQSINNTGGTFTFTTNQLDSINKVSGSLTLNTPFTHAGTIRFISGVVNTGPVNLLTMAAGSVVSNASNASFVNGPVAKVGNTAFTFPVGKTNTGYSANKNGYAALTISNSVGGAPTDQYTAEYIRASAQALGPITAIGLNHVSRCDYWVLDQDAGTSTLDVTLSWQDSINNCSSVTPYVNNLPSLVVAHHDGVNWDTYGGVGTGLGSSASGTVTWPGVSVFSPFAIGSVDFTNPLPITINFFNGTKNNGNHLLNWKVTCVSSPSANIELERSTDGISYSSIYSIFATAVRCQQPFDYTDNAPAKGVNYYRIKMTDATGKVTYSSIVSLINATKGIDIMNIAPNPIVNGNFNIKISTAEKVQMELVITDMQGRILQKQSVNTIAGFNSVPVNVRSLAAGTYQLFGTGADGRTRVLRFVIQ